MGNLVIKIIAVNRSESVVAGKLLKMFVKIVFVVIFAVVGISEGYVSIFGVL